MEIVLEKKVAFVIPCYNEELSISQVVKKCQEVIPSARVVICDNNSTDNTAKVALESGAEVINEPRKGKGNAVRRLFSHVEADIYVMLDGDLTYDIEAIPNLVDVLNNEGLAMVVGRRIDQGQRENYRSGHRFFWLKGF